MIEQTIAVTQAEFQSTLVPIIQQYKPTDESPVEYELTYPEFGKVLLVVNGDRYTFEVSE